MRASPAGRLCLLAGLALAGPADAADLFRPITPDDARAAAAIAADTAGTRRHRLVRVDADALGELTPTGAGTPDEPVTIAFFPDVVATFRRAEVEATTAGAIWAGRAVGDAPGSVTLVVEGGSITGHAEVGGRVFRIDPVAGGAHRVGEIDPRAEKPDIVVVPPGSRRAPLARPRAEPLAPSTIRVLVAYTKTAEAEAPNIVRRIDLAVRLANEAYAASGARLRLELAGRMKVGWTESSNFADSLTELTSGPKLAEVRALRDTVAADIAVLMRGRGGFCGIGHLLLDPGQAGMADLAYAVVAQDCVNNHSFAHELGHVMGLEHDRTAVFWDSPKQYNYGFVNLPAKIRDIMAYNTACETEGFDCARVKMFSTPRRPYEGSKLGRRAASPEAADGVRRLNETRGDVAGFR